MQSIPHFVPCNALASRQHHASDEKSDEQVFADQRVLSGDIAQPGNEGKPVATKRPTRIKKTTFAMNFHLSSSTHPRRNGKTRLRRSDSPPRTIGPDDSRTPAYFPISLNGKELQPSDPRSQTLCKLLECHFCINFQNSPHFHSNWPF